LFKLAAGGAQDAWDIARLLKVSQPTVIAEVEERLSDLPSYAAELWQRILQER
jgi:hypothetical protein